MVQTSIPVGRSTRKTALLNSSNNSPYAITFSVKWFGVLCCIIEKTKIEKYKRREKPGSKLPNFLLTQYCKHSLRCVKAKNGGIIIMVKHIILWQIKDEFSEDEKRKIREGYVRQRLHQIRSDRGQAGSILDDCVLFRNYDVSL